MWKSSWKTSSYIISAKENSNYVLDFESYVIWIGMLYSELRSLMLYACLQSLTPFKAVRLDI